MKKKDAPKNEILSLLADDYSELIASHLFNDINYSGIVRRNIEALIWGCSYLKILILFVFKTNINIGLNILMFIVALVFAYLISFLIDFLIGLISFYTESIWGISITKEAVVLLLSGAVIPLPFFPDIIRRVVELLPFKAIYHIPLNMLVSYLLHILLEQSKYYYFSQSQ